MRINLDKDSQKIYNTAVILCGGKGTRLGQIGKKLPKTLVKIQGKEILWYIINILKMNNFNHFILPLGYKGGLVKKFVKKNQNFRSNLELIDTGINSNIGKRIYKIRKRIKSKNFLLLNGDAIFDFNLKKYFNYHESKKYGSTFVTGESTYQYGTIGTKFGKVIDFKRNIVYDSVNVRNSKNYIAYNYTGIIILNKNLMNKYSKSFKNFSNFEKELFPKIIRKSKSNFIKLKGFFHSMDNLKDIDMVNKMSLFPQRYKGIKKIKRKIYEN